MLKACRGVVLATGLLSLPLFAQADCPPEDSIDRYAQTAGDALTALHELVPESQQKALEDRYSAMLVLKWQWQGRDGVLADEKAMSQLRVCYLYATCGIRTTDQIRTEISATPEGEDVARLTLADVLPEQPTARSFAWAERVLGCNAPPPAPVIAASVDPVLEPANTQNEQVVQTDPGLGIAASEPADQAPAQTSRLAQLDPILPTPQPATLLRPALESESVTLPSNADVELASSDTQVLEAEIDPSSVMVAQPAAVNVDQLMLSATQLVSAGKPREAIDPLETACFVEARDKRKSNACETLFSVYTNALVASEYSGSSQAYQDLSQRLCEIGYSRGCDNLSRHFAAQNSADAHRAAVAYAEKSCDLGSAEACATVSSFYLAGRASEPDPTAARAKLEQSCELGRLLSCQEVADFYLRGVGGDPDPAIAMELVEASCPAGSTERADLCVSAADYILINETAGAARSARVRTFIKRACDIGHDVGCAWYAEDLEMGIGGAVDLRAARKARVTACQYGDRQSCNSRS